MKQITTLFFNEKDLKSMIEDKYDIKIRELFLDASPKPKEIELKAIVKE